MTTHVITSNVFACRWLLLVTLAPTFMNFDTDRQTGIQTGRQTDRQTGRQEVVHLLNCSARDLEAVRRQLPLLVQRWMRESIANTFDHFVLTCIFEKKKREKVRSWFVQMECMRKKEISQNTITEIFN